MTMSDRPGNVISIADLAARRALVYAKQFDAELMGGFVDHRSDSLAYSPAMSKPTKKEKRFKRKIAAIEMINARTWYGRTRLQLSPGLNVIVGPSDSGKSNVVRNVLSVAENCSAESLLTRDQTGGHVGIEFNDATNVFLSKGAKRNEYAIGTTAGASGKQERFDSVGMSVPDAVAAFLSLGTVDMGGEPVLLNIQSQRGPVLLVDDTPARVARVVGSVSGLDVIHRAVAGSAKANRDAEQAGNVARKAAKVAAEDFRAARDRVDLPRATAALAAAEEADSARLAALSRVEDLEAGAEAVRQARVAYGAVKRVQGGAEVVGVRVRGLLGKLGTARERLAALESGRRAVEAARAVYGEAKRQQQAAGEARAEAEGELEQFRSGLEVCPVCDQPWDHGHESGDPNESRGVL